MEDSSIMFALLRSVFQKRDLEEDIKTKLSSQMLCEVYKLAQKHDVVHLIAQALEITACFWIRNL